MSEKRMDEITERLVAQADKELTERIITQFEGAWKALCGHCAGDIEMKATILGTDHRPEFDATVRVYCATALNMLQLRAFEVGREKNRQAKLTTFLKLVDDLGDCLPGALWTADQCVKIGDCRNAVKP